jgi:hypothetical protein
MMQHTRIGERVEVDLFGLRLTSDLPRAPIARGIIVAIAPGTITVRLEGRRVEITVGPNRLVRSAA